MAIVQMAGVKDSFGHRCNRLVDGLLVDVLPKFSEPICVFKELREYISYVTPYSAASS